MNRDTLIIGMLIYPDMTHLDFAGPFEVLAKLPQARCEAIWKSLDPVRTDAGLVVLPTATFEDCRRPDVIFVPGGPGQVRLMDDGETLDFISRCGAHAQWVTSVCTGALLLGAAGLLQGYRAATHWSAMDQLDLFGAIATHERVVVDRNRMTGGGVTAGIDFGIRLAAKIAGEDYARRVELGLEYAPEPPFGCGTPALAPADLVDAVRTRAAARNADRRAASERAAKRLR